MLDGIHLRASLSRFGFGTCAVLRVGAVSFQLPSGNHAKDLSNIQKLSDGKYGTPGHFELIGLEKI